MIVRPRVSVGSASTNSRRQEAEASYSDKCELERCAAAISNSSIAYLISTMHDG
jgi:hypothetical protein